MLFPDVEAWAVTHLETALAARPESYASNVHVGTAVPEPRVDRMVVVRRDGGGQTGIFDNARLSWRVWAGTEADASDLARLVGALLWAAPDGNPVVRVTHESGPSRVIDDSRQPQRLALTTIRTRGEQLS
ncbi:hypothetical protein [Nocardioides marinquilinus]